MSKKMSAISVVLTMAILSIAMAVPASAEGGSAGDPRDGVEIVGPIAELVLAILNGLGIIGPGALLGGGLLGGLNLGGLLGGLIG